VPQTIAIYEFLANAAAMAESSTEHQCWLIADIGATSSRCAILHMPGGDISAPRVYDNDAFSSLYELLADFLVTSGDTPRCCALAVAAPVLGNDVRMINRDWRFDTAKLGDEFGFEQVRILNDFHAIAFALPAFDDGSRIEIGQVKNHQSGNIAVLGPGSGLGMATWVGEKENGVAMCGEGGHITLAGRNDAETMIIEKLRERYGHCSAERVLSGPGLIALHAALHGIDVATSEEITSSPDDANCDATMQQFFSFLGSVAADLALITGAFGGVYIAGGIVPACVEQLKASDFRSRFEDKNRYRGYMESIPTYVITDPYPGLKGLAEYVARRSIRGD
jgi:glucokinase